MPFFRDETHLYQLMQALFDQIRQLKPNPIDSFTAQKLLLRLQLTKPNAQISINGRCSPAQVTFGNHSKFRPELDVQMDADVLHHILLDQLSLKTALANRLVQVAGPIWKTTPLAEVLQQGRLLYPQIVQANSSSALRQ